MEWDMSSKSIAAPSASQRLEHEHEAFGSRTSMQRPERLIGFNEVHNRVGLSRTSVWRLERSGHFPRSVQISPAGEPGVKPMWISGSHPNWGNPLHDRPSCAIERRGSERKWLDGPLPGA